MNKLVWFWLCCSLVAEVFGDVAIKLHYTWISLLAYNVMLWMWFKAVASAGNNITVPGIVWLLGGEMLLFVVGVLIFKESITIRQTVGIFLGLVATILIST